MIEGRGKIVDPHTVCVQGKNYTVCPYYLMCHALHLVRILSAMGTEYGLCHSLSDDSHAP